jgi:type IX secretion system PorP/SprF family membrane protein
MIRTLYVLAFLMVLVVGQTAMAQQDPQFSMYMYNPLYYNPAAAGSEGVSRLQITQRMQYLGYQTIGNNDPGGAQSSQLLSFNMPLAKIKSGIGIYALNDKFGPTINQAVQLSYAYRMTMKNGTLAIGVQAGMFNRGFDFGQLRPGEPGDPLIPTGRISQFKPDLGAGVYYNTTDYWVGVSMTHINKATYTYITDRSIEPSNSKAYLTAGYRLGIGYDIDVQPSVLIQYSTVEGIRGSVASLNLIATYDNRIWGGVGYRWKDAVMATAGINLMRNNALRVGYSLDVTAGGSQIKSPTSHELLLAYAFPAPDARKKPIIRTPRFRY